MSRLPCLMLAVLLFGARAGQKRRHLDTASSVSEAQWFHAGSNWEMIAGFTASWQGVADLHAIDCFGASQSIARAYRRRGFRAEAFDIQINPLHDASTAAGWWSMMLLFLRLHLRGRRDTEIWGRGIE